MKKYLLPRDGNFYKANLHMHTTISDGKFSPEETKKAYMEQGYSIIAFTDHETMVPHPELTDENFLAITSVEISINGENVNDDFDFIQTYHLNLYSRDPNKNCFTTFDKNAIWLKHAHNYISKEQEKNNIRRHYSIDEINKIIAMAKEDNCFVSYNHPFWSIQNYQDYSNLKGVWGVEWYNTGCMRAGYIDSMQPIDDLLRLGENVFPLASDDSHNENDRFGGFVMVKSKSLEYNEVINALERGDFYSSSKPLIEELNIEDGIINIKTSPVMKIFVTSDCRFNRYVSAEDENGLTEASIDITKFINGKPYDRSPSYIRISIVDKEGNFAHTKAYYQKDLIY